MCLTIFQAVCNIDLNECPPASPPSTGNACYCTEAAGNIYTFFIRSRVQKIYSEKNVIAEYQSTNVLINRIQQATVIGTFPVIFGEYLFLFILMIFPLSIIAKKNCLGIT